MPEMGTLRLSAPRNQMRKVQSTASRVGVGRVRGTTTAAYDDGVAARSCRNTGANGRAVRSACDGESAVTAFVGFCFGRMHDFIAAQQSAHCRAVMPRIGMLQVGPAARNERARSARSRNAASAIFFTRH